MKYLDLDQYTYKEENLLAHGFQQGSSGYVRSYSLHQGEYSCQIQITKNAMSILVHDVAADEEFLPFYVKHNQGAFVSEIRAEVNAIIEQLFDQCFTRCDVKEQLLAYAQECFQTAPVYPWKDLAHCVLKSSLHKKWYAIVMRIPYEALKIERQGSVDIVNVKADPQMITQLIDRQHYFPAYHMNKKHWITILLDRNTDMDKVKELLHNSYLLVEGK